VPPKLVGAADEIRIDIDALGFDSLVISPNCERKIWKKSRRTLPVVDDGNGSNSFPQFLFPAT